MSEPANVPQDGCATPSELGYRTLKSGSRERLEPVNPAKQMRFENALAQFRQR